MMDDTFLPLPARGVVIGKFYPYHLGHDYLFRVAQQNCKELHILVCYRSSEDPSGVLRFDWVKDSHPNAKVQLREDVYDRNDDSALWARLTVEWLGFVPDICFTSEEYGERWSQLIGCRYLLVDLDRKTVLTSGTAIRKTSGLGPSWSTLPPCVKSYYAVRVVVMGSESTGKTTLCSSLASCYGASLVAEYGAELSTELLQSELGGSLENSLDQTLPFTHELFIKIVREQARREDEGARASPTGLVICDTNVAASTIWYDRYLPFATAAERSAFHAEVGHLLKRPALYLISDVTEDTPFVQNGICLTLTESDGEEHRERMGREFLQLAASPLVRGEGGGGGGTTCAVLRGGWKEREQIARHFIDKIMAGEKSEDGEFDLTRTLECKKN